MPGSIGLGGRGVGEKIVNRSLERLHRAYTPREKNLEILCALGPQVPRSPPRSFPGTVIFFRSKFGSSRGPEICLATTDLWCGKTRCALWQDKMTRVARQNHCCGKTQGRRPLGRLHKGGRPPSAAAPLCGSLVSCHNSGFVLPQQSSCLATAHISSCHTRDPSWQDRMCRHHHPSSCIMHQSSPTSDVPMLFGHNSTLAAPFGASMTGICIIFQRASF